MIAAAAAAALALAASPGAGRDAASLAREVQAYYDRTKELEARFVQTYTYAAFGRTQTSRGVLRVRKPGKLRWDYSAPAEKTVLVNGSRLVQWEPEVNQAYVDEHFDASALSAAVTFLVGEGRLDREFALSTDAEGRLVLTPRQPDARVREVVLTVGEGGVVTATRVVDGSGNVNALEFQGVKRNPGLAEAVFTLSLPKDVHYIQAR
mgnify:CR=1 FL=1